MDFTNTFNTLTLEEITRVIFSIENDQNPTEVQIIATHRFIMRSSRFFTPQSRLPSSHRQLQTFRVYSPEQVGNLQWLENKIITLTQSREPGFQKYCKGFDPSSFSKQDFLKNVKWLKPNGINRPVPFGRFLYFILVEG